MPDIGGHVSAQGGLFRAIINGEKIGATTIQMYGASPRMWSANQPETHEVEKFKETRKNSSIKSVYLHAAYLVNLASPSDEVYEKSIKNLSDHLNIAEAIGADGLIFHVGSGKESSKEKALEKEVRAIKEVLKNTSGKSYLVMENSAGGGAKIGSAIDEIKHLFNELRSKRVKVCFDTAHAFEAGMIEKYTKENVKKLFDDWDKAIGLENIVALHVNDSKTKYSSHNDKHENIGEGEIGIDGFKALASEKRLWDKAWILEVPGFDDMGPDKKNIDILRSLFQ